MKKLLQWLEILGLTWFVPVIKFIQGDNRPYQAKCFVRMVGLPLLSIGVALFAWHLIALKVKLGTMTLPTPAVVYARMVEMTDEWQAERVRHGQYEVSVQKMMKDNGMSDKDVREAMPYEQKKIFVGQVWLSLKTAFTGVFLAVIIAVPIGVLCGLSTTIYEMFNPLIQVFKPVSPLAWFPVVYIFINKVMEGANNDGTFNKSFVIAALVVALCALWPALLNTANGVANVEKDYLNVARVLNLPWYTRIWRIILPASVPAIFTGIRTSMGIGWMVLIAAEMMAVSPGLGGFIWDWYQSSNEIALAYLVLSVLVIGAIGFVIDRIMIAIQKSVSHGNAATIR